MRLSWGLVACALLSGVLVAQTVPGVRRPGSSQTAAWGCPRSVPPVTGNAVASSSDYVEMSRRACATGCPAYTVRVSGDGTVSWSGEKEVQVLGQAHGSVNPDDARAMMQNLADRGFWGLCNGYGGMAGGNIGTVTTLSIGGQTRTVEETDVAGPAWLRELDVEIDSLADTHRWRHGGPNEETFEEDRTAVDAVLPKVGVTRLMKAAARDRIGELREMLADTSLEVDAVDSSGWTALMYAAQAGRLDAVKMLIARRADVLKRSNAGETAMSAAVSSTEEPNPQEKVRVLCAAGLNINAADNRGVTPLMLAVVRVDRPALVAAMMKLGADPTKRDVEGNSAMDYLEAQDDAKRIDPGGYEAIRKMLAGPVGK